MFGRKLITGDQDIWFTSDLHFFHKGVLSFCEDTRPWEDLETMHEGLIGEWNSKVKPDDIIFHLGDFSFKGKSATEDVLSQLNGRKIMILGNHDKVLRSAIKTGTHGIEFIGDYLEIRINGTKVCMSHFPMASWNQQGRGSLMLFGHTHGSYKPDGRTMDVGYDNFGTILSADSVLEYLLSKEIYTVDPHKEVR